MICRIHYSSSQVRDYHVGHGQSYDGDLWAGPDERKCPWNTDSQDLD